MGLRTWIEQWPVYRQLTGDDPLGRGSAAYSRTTQTLVPRTLIAEKVVKSVCPYCAVGCGQNDLASAMGMTVSTTSPPP
jgi:formate dehydrogenase major subunit